MSRTIYLNGRFMPETEASLPIFDRGTLFADAVYEGIAVLDGHIIDFDVHMARLKRSLGEIAVPVPMTELEVLSVLCELIKTNRITEGFLYLQVTRGTADRDYLSDNLTPNVFAFTQDGVEQPAATEPKPLRMHSTPDLRWARRDIKSTNLLGQVLAKRAAREAGADEALMIDPEGFVTEGGATSFFAVVDGTILARPLSNDILPGVTRRAMLALAERDGVVIDARRFTLNEALTADEAFITGSTTYVTPIGEIDGQKNRRWTAGSFDIETARVVSQGRPREF